MTAQARVLTPQERSEYIEEYNGFRNVVARNLRYLNQLQNNFLPAVSSLVKTLAVGAIATVAVLFAFGFKTLATSIFIVSVTVVGLLSLGVRLANGSVRIARETTQAPEITLPPRVD